MTSKPRPARGSSNEGFAWIDGKKSDAGFHAEFLDDPEAGKIALRDTRKRAREWGWSEEEIEDAYGKD